MSLIDAHVHLYPPEINRDPAAWAAVHGETHWATLATRRRREGGAVQTFPSVDELLHEMDAAGIERSVLLGWYWLKPETAVRQNRFYAECVRGHPTRFSGFATFHPAAGRDATLAELRRARDEGLVGIGELSPHSQGYAVDHPIFEATLALAAEWRWPVNVHVTCPDARAYPGHVPTPLDDFVQLAQKFPATHFILAHWAGLLPLRPEFADRVRVLANVFYDTAASPLLYDGSVWSRFLSVVSSDRVLFGSDFPLNLYPRVRSTPKMADLIAEAHAAKIGHEVFRENALRLLDGARARRD
jgi:predicted TIM-barrel fold metal-dependent hydrolase